MHSERGKWDEGKEREEREGFVFGGGMKKKKEREERRICDDDVVLEREKGREER